MRETKGKIQTGWGGGAERGIKNWGQGGGQREMEIAGSSGGCRKKREEFINGGK